MDQLGAYLKEVRESKKLTIDKVVEDLHILKKYIVAIENEDFSIFPGEAYLKGFIRSYAMYLGLNADDIIRRYERIKISEMPSPIDQLIPKPKADLTKFFVYFLIVSVFLLIGGSSFIIFNFLKSKVNINTNKVANNEKSNNKSSDSPKNEGIILTKDNEVLNLKKGEKVGVNVGNNKYFFWIDEIGPVVSIKTNNDMKKLLIGNGYINKIDLNGDNIEDITIVLTSWDDKIAKLNVSKINKSDIYSENNLIAGDTVQSYLETDQIRDFSLEVSFLGDTYFKYIVDDEKPVEKNFNNGSVVKIVAKKSVYMFFSNGGVARLEVEKSGKKNLVGENGEVVAKLINWVATSNGYSLKSVNLR